QLSILITTKTLGHVTLVGRKLLTPPKSSLHWRRQRRRTAIATGTWSRKYVFSAKADHVCWRQCGSTLHKSPRTEGDGMRTLRLLVPPMLTAGLLTLAAAPASAAPPGNDEPQGAVVLHLGDRVVQNTSEATTNAQDEALNANCGAPATNASVWYKYSPHVDRNVVLDATASSYSSGMLVFKGTPTARSLVTCGPGSVVLRARAGKTYNIMVISDTNVNGGKLVLMLKKAPPPPRVHVSVGGRRL